MSKTRFLQRNTFYDIQNIFWAENFKLFQKNNFRKGNNLFNIEDEQEIKKNYF